MRETREDQPNWKAPLPVTPEMIRSDGISCVLTEVYTVPKSEISGNRLPRRQRTYAPYNSFKPKLEKRNKREKGSHQPGRPRNPVTERVSGIIKKTLPRSTGLIAGAEDRKSWNNNTFLEANKTTHKKKPTKTKWWADLCHTRYSRDEPA